MEEEIYHVFNRSIADFIIFNGTREYQRMLRTLSHYQLKGFLAKFSQVHNQSQRGNWRQEQESPAACRGKHVDIIAYCLMPTHLHLVLRQRSEKGMATFMGNALNSYTRYFNIKHHRKGPLWEGKYKRVLVESEEQLQHLIRYIHLNPVTAYLVEKPQAWPASSYREYIGKVADDKAICVYDDVLDIQPSAYAQFTEDMISYERELATIKKLTFE